jgi:hypothetical protein
VGPRRSTFSASSGSSTSGTSGAIIEVEGETPPGNDRHSALVLVFAFVLAAGVPLVGRDGPLATAPFEPAPTLSLPAGTQDVTLFTFPDRLANEPLANLEFAPVSVRATQGLAAKVGSPGGVWVVTWTERGTAYWMYSEHRDIPDLLRLAGSLR